MDTAGVVRAALFAWGDGGQPVAAFFAGAQLERTVALCIDPHICLRRSHDYPFEETEEEFEARLSSDALSWGDEEAVYDASVQMRNSLDGKPRCRDSEQLRAAWPPCPECGSRPTSETS